MALFTAIFPYLVLAILLVRGVTLPGASDGLHFYLTPQWHKLADPTVWIAAASQIFYSVGVGWGTLVAFASYNDASHNFVRDAWLVPLINCSTSFLAGIVVFSILGYMSHLTGRPVDEVQGSSRTAPSSNPLTEHTLVPDPLSSSPSLITGGRHACRSVARRRRWRRAGPASPSSSTPRPSRACRARRSSRCSSS